MKQRVLMIGDALDGPGGISAVARTYRDSGMLAALDVDYLSNYDGAGVLRQSRLMLRLLTNIAHAMHFGAVALLHVHTASRGGFWRAFLLCELARHRRIPYVLHVHSGEFVNFFENECGSLRKSMVRRALRDAARVVCVTPGWCRDMATIEPRARFAALPNPVEPPADPFTVGSEDSSLLFLGRITEKKGVFDLIVALAILRERGIEVKLRVGGAGDDAAMLEKARSLGVEDLVDYCGWVGDSTKDSLLRHTTMLIAPSHFEAFGVSIVEAMAYGKPVIATRVGGIPEVLDDGIHGLLVPAGEPVALADAIAHLLSDRALRQAMGQSGRQHALTNFTTGRVRADLGLIYGEILGAGPV